MCPLSRPTSPLPRAKRSAIRNPVSMQLLAGVVVETSALLGGTDAAPVVLAGAALVQVVGVSLGEGEGTAVEVAGREELGGAGGAVVEAFGVLAGALVVVGLSARSQEVSELSD